MSCWLCNYLETRPDRDFHQRRMRTRRMKDQAGNNQVLWATTNPDATTGREASGEDSYRRGKNVPVFHCDCSAKMGVGSTGVSFSSPSLRRSWEGLIFSEDNNRKIAAVFILILSGLTNSKRVCILRCFLRYSKMGMLHSEAGNQWSKPNSCGYATYLLPDWMKRDSYPFSTQKGLTPSNPEPYSNVQKSFPRFPSLFFIRNDPVPAEECIFY